MRAITNLMINDFKLKKLGYDFMGFSFKRKEQLSFHHLIFAHKNCKELHIPSEGYLYWNGAILRQDTSHDYLHILKKYDPEIFYLITSELIDENIKRKLTLDSLRRIRTLLEYFEKEHCSTRTKKGNLLIKESYVRDRIRLWQNKN